MKFLLICILCVFAVLSEAAPLYKGKFREFPATGTIHPESGTIELTLCPAKPATEFENEWAFAFEMVPAVGSSSDAARTLLGICCASGENNQRGLFAIVRNGNESGRASVAREAVLAENTPVNLALTWGSKGVRLFVNGRQSGETGRFPGKLQPMPGNFRISAGAPYFVRQMRISSKELEPEQFGVDPSRPFESTSDTTLLWDGTRTFMPVSKTWRECRMLPVWSLLHSFSLPGEPATLQLDAANFNDSEAVFEVLLATPGQKERREVVKVPPHTRLLTVKLALPVESPGHYPFRLKIKGPTSREEYTFAHARLNRTDSALPDGAFCEYIGHHLFNLTELLQKLGIRWSRSDAFKWFAVEPVKGKFDWRWSDEMVARAEKNGVKMLGVLGNPPAWAADSKQFSTHKNAAMTCTRKPRSIVEWENYVGAVAARYKGRVEAWEIWNEVDWHPPAPAASFSGSTEEYLEMLKAAHRAIRRADPKAKILVSGFGYGTACDQQMPFELLRMGAAQYCDFYNVHSYQGLWGIRKLSDAVQKARPGMKLWQSEQMWHTIADPHAQAVLTTAIQFWFIAEGFEKYFSFGEDFFFTHHTLSPIPALPALAFAANMLRVCDRYTGTLREEPAGNYDLKHTFLRSDGSVLTVLGRTSIAGRWKLEGDILAVYDLFGAPVKLTDGTTEKPAELLYIVSRTPLKKITEVGEVANFCPNGSFEEISGDIAMGGMRNAVAEKWQFRARNYDPAGEVFVTRDAAEGLYALQLNSSGQGRVYAFFDARLSGAGKYRMEGLFKNVGNQAVAPYFDVFDRTSGYFKRYHAQPVEPGREFVSRSVVIDAPETAATLVFTVGIEKSGKLVVDDLTLRRDRPQPRKLDAFVFPAGASAVATRPGKQVSSELLSEKIKNKIDAAGFEFTPVKRPQLLSAGNWKGIDGKSITISARGKKGVVLLLGAAYVPERADVLGTVTCHYADASISSPVALRNGRDLRDWFLATQRNGISPAVRFISDRMNEYGLFAVEILNPEPEKEFTSLTVSASGDAILLLVAGGLLP